MTLDKIWFLELNRLNPNIEKVSLPSGRVVIMILAINKGYNDIPIVAQI